MFHAKSVMHSREAWYQRSVSEQAKGPPEEIHLCTQTLETFGEKWYQWVITRKIKQRHFPKIRWLHHGTIHFINARFFSRRETVERRTEQCIDEEGKSYQQQPCAHWSWLAGSRQKGSAWTVQGPRCRKCCKLWRQVRRKDKKSSNQNK